MRKDFGQLLVGFSSLGLAGLALVVANGGFISRPPITYLTYGIVLGSMLVVVVYGTSGSIGFSRILLLSTLVGLVIKLSVFNKVVTSGIDHARWIQRVQDILATNHVAGSDMYGAAPFYLLKLAVAQRIAGLEPFQTRFVTILFSSVLPLAIYLLAKRLTGNRRIALFALIIAVPQMLFLRTSVLLESESIAIVWSIAALYFLYRYIQYRDDRLFYIFVVLTTLSVFLHFLYAVVIFGISIGTQVLLYATWKIDDINIPLDVQKVKRLAAANILALLFIPSYILASTYRGAAIDTLKSVTKDDTSDPTSGAVGGSTSGGTTTQKGGSTSGGTTTPSETTVDMGKPPMDRSPDGSVLNTVTAIISDAVGMVFGLIDPLIPDGGTVGASIGAGGDATVANLTGAFAPLVIFLAFAFVGGVVTLRRRNVGDLFLLASGATTALGTTLAIAVDLQFNLGYRIYYFLAAILVVFAGIGLNSLSSMEYDIPRQTAARATILIFFVGYATLAPMSPLGNNVDPRFGGNEWYLTATEYEQIELQGEILGDSDEATVDSRIPQLAAHLQLYAADDDLYLTREPCPRADVIISGGDVRVCHPTSVGSG